MDFTIVFPTGGNTVAIVPTPEQSARVILKIFVERFDRRPGQVLRQKNFHAMLHEFGIKASDFNTGLQLAIKRGWLESAEVYVHAPTEDDFGQA